MKLPYHTFNVPYNQPAPPTLAEKRPTFLLSFLLSFLSSFLPSVLPSVLPSPLHSSLPPLHAQAALTDTQDGDGRLSGEPEGLDLADGGFHHSAREVVAHLPLDKLQSVMAVLGLVIVAKRKQRDRKHVRFS